MPEPLNQETLNVYGDAAAREYLQRVEQLLDYWVSIGRITPEQKPLLLEQERKRLYESTRKVKTTDPEYLKLISSPEFAAMPEPEQLSVVANKTTKLSPGEVLQTPELLPLYSETSTYHGGLGKEYQKQFSTYLQSKAEYEEWERQQEELYKPITLPSGETTSRSVIIEQQRNQARNIANAQAAAEYEARQKSQAKQLEGEANRQRGDYLTSAFQQAKDIMTPPPLQYPSEVISAAMASAPSQALRGFIGSAQSDVIRQFEMRFPGARERWNAAAHPYRTYQGEILPVRGDTGQSGQGVGTPVGSETGAWAVNRALVTGGGLPSGVGTSPDTSWRNEQMREIDKMVAQDIERMTGKRLEGGSGEPLSTWLANFPWYQEYLKIAPAQRGFFPQRYKPSANWLSG